MSDVNKVVILDLMKDWEMVELLLAPAEKSSVVSSKTSDVAAHIFKAMSNFANSIMAPVLSGVNKIASYIDPVANSVTLMSLTSAIYTKLVPKSTGSTFDMYQWINLTFKSSDALKDIVEKVKNTFESIMKTAKEYKVVESIGVAGKFIEGALGLLAIYLMFKGYERIFTKDELSKKIDGGITVVQSLGGLTEAASSTLQGVSGSSQVFEALQKIALVAKNILTATNVLYIFALVLSSVNIVQSTKGCIESGIFLKNVKELKTKDKTYVVALTALMGMKGIKKHTSLKKGELFDRIDSRFKLLKPTIQEKVAQEIFEAIIGRVQAKMVSDGLDIAAGGLSIIGSGITLAAPAAPVGLAFLAGACLTNIGKFAYNYFKNQAFEEILPPAIKADS